MSMEVYQRSKLRLISCRVFISLLLTSSFFVILGVWNNLVIYEFGRNIICAKLPVDHLNYHTVPSQEEIPIPNRPPIILRVRNDSSVNNSRYIEIESIFAVLSVENTTENTTTMPPSTPQTDYPDWGLHTLAVIVPFRDRFDELSEFVPYMEDFLNKQKIRHNFYVINQQGHYRFNRAALINVGFKESRSECDYLAIHDVDLVPVNPNISYAYPDLGAVHLTPPYLHPLYHYALFLGGIILLNGETFEKINGMSNNFWGWGREDDDLHDRLNHKGVKVYGPTDITTGYKTFKHLHDDGRRPRDAKHFEDQLKVSTSHGDSGLSNLQYTVLSRQENSITGVSYTVINADIKCNTKRTPWCAVEL